MRHFFVAALFALQLAPVAHAGDGSITETIVWGQMGQGRDIAVSYSRDRDGVGKLQFRELQRRGNLPITYLVESNKDIVKNLVVVSMQPFEQMFILTLKADSSYIVQMFTYDERLAIITEVANANGHWLPELFYFGDNGDPAVGILKQQQGSTKTRSASMICGERMFVFNQRTSKIEEVMGRWSNRGRAGDAPAQVTGQCTE